MLFRGVRLFRPLVRSQCAAFSTGSNQVSFNLVLPNAEVPTIRVTAQSGASLRSVLDSNGFVAVAPAQDVLAREAPAPEPLTADSNVGDDVGKIQTRLNGLKQRIAGEDAAACVEEDKEGLCPGCKPHGVCTAYCSLPEGAVVTSESPAARLRRAYLTESNASSLPQYLLSHMGANSVVGAADVYELPPSKSFIRSACRVTVTEQLEDQEVRVEELRQ